MPDQSARRFTDQDGKAILRSCAFLFIDILGVREMAKGPETAARLADLRTALRRPLGDFFASSSPWPAAFFSDTLVMLDPINERVGAHLALLGLAIQASWIQMNLTAAGFFVRGSLTLGEAHLEDRLLYGPALVDAYDLERTVAVNPRIVLSSKAVAEIAGSMTDNGQVEGGYLRVEQDGSVFIDYLDILLDDPADPVPFLEEHRDMVRAKLSETRGDSRKWDKYRWVAEYHDAYCRSELPRLEQLLIGSDGHERRFERFRVDAASNPKLSTDQ